MTPTTEERALRADVTVLPMRFTADVARMRDFLALLGLSPKVSREEDWVTMAGDAGMVALHTAASTSEQAGTTTLWFETSDLETLRAGFAAAGFEDIDIYDEAFGRELTVRDQAGRELGFEQPSDDLHGYRLDDPTPRHGVLSMPVRFEDPAGPFGRMLLPAGFGRLDEGDDEWWRVWSSDGGLIALHRPTDDAEPGSVRLGFRTREPLEELADRLVAAGHADVGVSEDFGGQLSVTDPDGQPVLVQPGPGSRSA